jgi:hypothetical protein
MELEQILQRRFDRLDGMPAFARAYSVGDIFLHDGVLHIDHGGIHDMPHSGMHDTHVLDTYNNPYHQHTTFQIGSQTAHTPIDRDVRLNPSPTQKWDRY